MTIKVVLLCLEFDTEKKSISSSQINRIIIHTIMYLSWSSIFCLSRSSALCRCSLLWRRLSIFISKSFIQTHTVRCMVSYAGLYTIAQKTKTLRTRFIHDSPPVKSALTDRNTLTTDVYDIHTRQIFNDVGVVVLW